MPHATASRIAARVSPALPVADTAVGGGGTVCLMACRKWVWVGVACGGLFWASCSSDSGDSGPAGAAGVSGGAGGPEQGDAGAGNGALAGSGALAGNGGDKAPNGGTSGDAGGAAAMAGSGAAPSDGGSADGIGGVGGVSGESEAAGAAGSADGGAGGQPGLTQLGDVSGACGLIDAAMIASDSPSTMENSITLGATGFTVDALSTNGLKIYDSNAAAGGESQAAAEALSFEVLSTCDAAGLVKTGDEIAYDTAGKKTDYSIKVDGLTVGVSVVRAFAFPDDTTFTAEFAAGLLEKKLNDILLSTSYVSQDDRWQKQILHVIARSAHTAATTIAAYPSLDPATHADTILVVTLTDGSDDAFYVDGS